MKNIMLIGGGVGNAVLFSIGKACLESNNKVLYFAGYKKLSDVFKRALIEHASNAVVWACEEGLIDTSRDQDKSFHGNIVDAIISYQQGKLGINLNAIDKIITIGSDKMMKAVNDARKTILKPYLKSSHIAISSVNSPMQCMMKEICAQCVQQHINKETGERSFVYSCSNQDQDMELVDFDFLSERLKQNSLQEKLTAKWIEHVQSIKQHKKEIREQYRTIRKDIDESYSNYAANSLINFFNQNLSYVKGKTIAAYIPMDGEINVMPLMHSLLNLDYKVAIPNKNQLLRFEEWNETNEDVIPDTIITPVIAFDDHFNRLGFGGGWYDIMIEKLRPLGKIFIGVAYEKQYCKDLPVEKHDQKLDIIITEMCVRFRGGLPKKADRKE